MKTHIYMAFCFAATLLYGCGGSKSDDELSHHHHNHSHAHTEAHNHGHEHSDGHAHDSHDADAGKAGADGEIVLDEHEAERLGVKVQEIVPAPFNEVVKVSGRVVASPSDVSVAVAKSSGIVTLSPDAALGRTVAPGRVLGRISAAGMTGGDGNGNALLALDIAKKELDRLTPLHAEGIVSTRDYNAAEAEYRRALAAIGSNQAGSNIIAPKGGVITDLAVTDGAYVEQGSSIATVTGNTRLMIQADMPVRYIDMIGNGTDCLIRIPELDRSYSLSDLDGRRVSDMVGSVKGGYIPVYFEVESDGILRDGMFVELYVKSGDARDALAVPIGAVAEQQGVNFIYERLDEDCYRKLPVTLGGNDGRMVEIVDGLDAGREIVVEGMLFVKLAESSGAVPEGHSHSH